MLSLRVGNKITFERFVVEGVLTGTLPTLRSEGTVLALPTKA